jgi:hypothetical protein
LGLDELNRFERFNLDDETEIEIETFVLFASAHLFPLFFLSPSRSDDDSSDHLLRFSREIFPSDSKSSIPSSRPKISYRSAIDPTDES